MTDNINIDSYELLYVYIDNLRCFNQHEFIFTTEYNISYNKDNKTISITDNNNNKHLKDFYGKEISNINIIVGKNGSGKSTLLNLLGYSMGERYTNFHQSTEKGWFAIYKTNVTNVFYIEGVCPDLIHINNISGPLESDYCVLYNKEKNIFNNYEFKNAKDDKKSYIFSTRKKRPGSYPEKMIANNYCLPREYIYNPIETGKNYTGLYYLLSTNHEFSKKSLKLDKLYFSLYFKKTCTFFSKEIESIFQQYLTTFATDKEKLISVAKINLYNSLVKNFESIDNNICINHNCLDFKNINQSIEKICDNYGDLIPNLNNLFNTSNAKAEFKRLIMDFLKSLESLPDSIFNKIFSNETSYKLNIFTDDFNNNIFNLFQYYQDILNYGVSTQFLLYDFIDIDFNNNISEGELNFIFTFSNIYYALLHAKQKSCLILLDEPDQSLHPDWISKFIYYMINLTDELNKRKKIKTKYQFIISTHSPFMLSDIPKEFITKVDIVTDDNGNHNRIVTKANKSFASNYYDLIQDSFFLDSPIGEFSKRKIESMIRDIDNVKTIEDYNNLLDIINIIDDRFIRNTIKNKLDQKCKTIDEKYKIEKEIEVLKERLKVLEEKSGENDD